MRCVMMRVCLEVRVTGKMRVPSFTTGANYYSGPSVHILRLCARTSCVPCILNPPRLLVEYRHTTYHAHTHTHTPVETQIIADGTHRGPVFVWAQIGIIASSGYVVFGSVGFPASAVIHTRSIQFMF